MADRQDFYDVLGVTRDADAKEIQRTYRKLARKYHPDFNKDPEAEQRFKEISEAYDVLSDPKTREKYDAFGPDWRHVPDDVDPETWKRAQARARQGGYAGQRGGDPFGGQSPFGGGGQYYDAGGGQYYSADDIDLDDLLGGMFGGGRGGGRRRQQGPIPGADQEYELELPVTEAYNGTRRQFTIQGPEGTRTVDVNIPAGVTDGQRIRLAGQGGQGYNGGPRGDLYLIARLAPDSRFRVEGRDIYVRLPVSPAEAALGATVPCDTPGGSAKVKVPPASSSGRKLRLRGRGMPSRSGTPGDLYAEVSIVFPGPLTDEQRALYEQLAATSGASSTDERSRA